jgi:hypothetical protein
MIALISDDFLNFKKGYYFPVSFFSQVGKWLYSLPFSGRIKPVKELN